MSKKPNVKIRPKDPYMGPPHAHVATECLIWTKDEPKKEVKPKNLQ